MVEKTHKLTDKKTVIGTGVVPQFAKDVEYTLSAFLADKMVKAGKVTINKKKAE